MNSKQPPVLWHNLFILSQYQYQLLAVFLFPIMVLTVAWFSAAFSWDLCTADKCSSLPRLGNFWNAVGFLYVLAEEIWKITPQSMHEEIEGSFSLIDDELEGAHAQKERFRRFAEITAAIRTPMVRSIESILIVGGALLGAFGDLAGLWLRKTLGWMLGA